MTRRPLSVRILDQLKRVPWWALSAATHVLLLLLLAHLTFVHIAREDEDFLIRVNLLEESPGEKEAEIPGPVTDEKPEPEPTPPLDVPIEPTPEPEPQVEQVVEVTTEVAPEEPPQETKPIIGVGSSAPSLFALRTPAGRSKAVSAGGGNARSENAVERGLRWLAAHQDQDGRWDWNGYTKHCPQDGPCPEFRPRNARVRADLTGIGAGKTDLDPGVTGLAVLCFLGAGHTHLAGDYRPVVRAGLDYLRSVQTADGCFGRDCHHAMYNHGIATLAVAEACAMTGDRSLHPLVQKGVEFIAETQQSGGGWDYRARRTGRNDTSIAGWQVMALKSAQAAGVEIPWKTLYGIVRHMDRRTMSSGEVVYADRGTGAGRRGYSMVAVGMVCRQFLGWSRESPILQRQARVLRSHRPAWEKFGPRSFESVYYWYYGTIAMFQMGGEHWRLWNGALRDLLIERQIGDGHAHGSWEPEDVWATTIGGRLYATTLNILNLEIYYRYLPMYKEASLDAVGTLLVAARARNQDIRRHALRILGQFDDSRAIRAIGEAARGADDVFVRLEAGKTLAFREEPAGVEALRALLKSENAFVRDQALKALAALGDRSLVPVFIEALRDDSKVVVGSAAIALRRLTDESFGFSSLASPEQQEAAIQRWQEWWKRREAPPPEKEHEAVVLAVHPDTGLVMIGLGTEHRVLHGDRFSIFRGQEYVGLVEVNGLYPDMSAAKVVQRFTKRSIRKGDRVAPHRVLEN